MRRVPLAITMGDPAGIGPEVVLKALGAAAVRRAVQPILVGDPGVWTDTASRLRVPLQIDPASPGGSGRPVIVATSELPRRARVPGKPRTENQAAACGRAAYAAITAGVELVRKGAAAAIVTAPISKAHLAAAGFGYPGHTELLAALCGNVPVRMMMAGATLRVVLATVHVPLREVPERLSQDAILETIEMTFEALRERFRIRRPRIAVAGLNPHAGEGGLFGDEDLAVIVPAVRRARQRRIDAVGPMAADGLFPQAARGQYDAVVAMYHDQGLGPFKLLHFADGVNCTLGLPFVRTAPDHGTAFDIAGCGAADAGSMKAAILLAACLASQPGKPAKA